jgi:hypothetical protein
MISSPEAPGVGRGAEEAPHENKRKLKTKKTKEPL